MTLQALRRWWHYFLQVAPPVADAADSQNLRRIRRLAPMVAVLNLIHVVVFVPRWIGHPVSTPTGQWARALVLAHLGMGVLMLLAAVASHHWQHQRSGLWRRGFPWLMAGLCLGFCALLAALDQWVTPSTTPFLAGCVLVGLLLHLRPSDALTLYPLACLGFLWAVQKTQPDPQQLLSNQVNGLTASMMGCALAIMLWRNFATITAQHALLDKVNQELQQKQRELERLTRQDGLTGLYNRNTFIELTRQELDRAQRQGSQTAVLLLDLDHFKRINDSHGHPAGDAVLCHVAQLINSTLRSTDLVGRLGGEEFVVLLPATPLADACRLAEKVRTRLQATPTPWNGGTIVNTVSVGVAGGSAKQRRSFENLYEEADQSMYLAKQRGRNQVVCCGHTIGRPATIQGEPA